MVKRLAILVVASICSLPLWAASPDIVTDSVTTENSAKMRFSVEIDKKLTKGLHLSIEEELRLRNMTQYSKGTNHFDRSYTGLELSYKTCDYVKVGLGYAFLAYYKDGKKASNYKDYWDLRNRVYLNITGSYKTVTGWKFSLRLRPEVTIRTDSINKLEKTKSDWVFRTRFMTSYEFRSKPIELFAYVELFNTLNALNPNESLAAAYKASGQSSGDVICDWDGQYVNNLRTSVGLNYRIDKRSSLKFYYRFDYSLDRDIHLNANYANNFKEFTLTKEKGYTHTLGIGYSYSF